MMHFASSPRVRTRKYFIRIGKLLFHQNMFTSKEKIQIFVKIHFYFQSMMESLDNGVSMGTLYIYRFTRFTQMSLYPGLGN